MPAKRKKRTNPYRSVANTALQPEFEERQRFSEDELEQTNKIKPIMELRQQQHISLVAVFGAIIAFMLAFGILVSYIQLQSVCANIVSYQSELATLQSDYDKLVAENEEVFDNDKLQEIIDKDNLTTPQSNQKVYLDLSDPDTTNLYSQNTNTGILQSILNFFNMFGTSD